MMRLNVAIDFSIKFSTILVSCLKIRKTDFKEWPSEVLYPSYCNGWLYVVTPKIVKLLLNAIETSPYLFIDDVYITGILR